MARSVSPFAALLLVAGLALVVIAGEPKQKAEPDKKAKPAPAYRFSGPYTHDNLTVFLIHGDDQIKGKEILTLQEALKQKKAVVHETQNVNQLAIENTSDIDVFLQAGDVLRGGQQDRIIAYDMIVTPKSGKVPLAAFCVEAGRWTQRGKEAAGQFSSSTNAAATNGLKIAARKDAMQKEVWENVDKAQKALEKNLKSDVKGAESKSSLELTLEHKKVIEAVDAYVKKLQDAPKDEKDVIGYAVVINGKVNNADVYASSGLFGKLWPKLLKASAVEAVAEKNDKKFKAATAEDVKTFLASADKGERSEKTVNARFKQMACENDKIILFETRDRDNKSAPVRRSYIGK
jgi:hypothetical protein